MSETAPEGIYVYQPGAVGSRKDGRLWALGGLPFGARFEGLTREEADAFAEALNGICWLTDVCHRCGHTFAFDSDGCPQCGADAAAPWVPRPETPSCECERCAAVKT